MVMLSASNFASAFRYIHFAAKNHYSGTITQIRAIIITSSQQCCTEKIQKINGWDRDLTIRVLSVINTIPEKQNLVHDVRFMN